MTAATLPQTTAEERPERNPFTGFIVAFTLVSLLAIGGLVALAISVTGNATTAATVEVLRDLFVILLTLELLLIGAAFVIMLVQVARFANLLQNELRPIIESSTETVNTVRGTVAFLSEKLVEPVVDANAVIAGAQRAFKLIKDLDFLRDIAAGAIAGMGQSYQTSTGPPDGGDSD